MRETYSVNRHRKHTHKHVRKGNQMTNKSNAKGYLFEPNRRVVLTKARKTNKTHKLMKNDIIPS